MNVNSALQVDWCEAVWTEDSNNVTVGVIVDGNVRGKQVELDVHPRRMALTIQGDLILEGDFPFGHDVIPNGSFFEMEEQNGKRMAIVTLEKKHSQSQWREFFAEDRIDLTITGKVVTLVLPAPIATTFDRMEYRGWHMAKIYACAKGPEFEC